MTTFSSLTPLIGRERELALALRFVDEDRVRLLTLTGPGGVGKTRLAMALVAALECDAAVAELDAVVDAAIVPATIAHALGVTARAGESEPEAVRRHLGDRRVLLVVDNVEHVMTAADLIADMLAACPGLTVVATSRAPLRIRGEQELPLAPLALPGAERSLAALDANPAVTLFLYHARAVRPDFALAPDTANIVAQIVTRLDGLPQAIELAAARLRLLPPASLLERLDQRLPILIGGPRDLPERLRTVRAAIAWSHELLDAEARALFRRLAVFAGGFSIDSAEAVQAAVAAALPGDADLDVLSGLAALRDHALIATDPDGDDARFDMLGTVREFALGELAASAEAELVRAAHARWFLDFAERAEPELGGPRQAFWLNALAREQDNLRSALGHLIERERADEALRLGSALWPYWARRGYLPEGREWLERALAIHGESQPERRARATLRLGNLALDLADPDRAEAMYLACLEARREIRDAPGIASALGALGLVALHRGDVDRAERLLEDARARIDTLDDPAGRARVRHNLGRAALAAGNTERARALLDEAAAIRREIGDSNGLAYTVLHLAEVAIAEHRADLAERLLHEARDRFDDQGDGIGVACTTHDLGLVAVQRNDAIGAEARFREALAARLEHADRQGVAESLEGIGGVAVAAGAPDMGARLLGCAGAWRAVTQMARMPVERDLVARRLADAEYALGVEAFAAATAAGQSATLEESARDVLASPPVASVLEQAQPREYGLTPREREVLGLLVEGKTDREIAESLYMAPRTVSWHVGHILARLNVESRTAAAALAVREGLA